MFRNKLMVICLLVAGGSLICAQSGSPLKPSDVHPSFPMPHKDVEEEITTRVVTPPSTTTTTTTTSTTTTTTTTTAPPTTTSTSTTTAAPDTTTAAPTPAPNTDPAVGKWNSSCIWLQMAAQLNFTYETVDNKNATAIYNIPASAVVHDASCQSETNQQIQLNWGPDDAIHSLTMQFERNNSNVNVYMIVIHLPIDASEFKNAKENQSLQLIYRGDTFEAPLHMSYHCTRPQSLNLTEIVSDKMPVGTIRLSDVQLEAFRNENSTQFSQARDCDSSETPDIVPIAIGIAMAALIAIVLIAYLCARRRSTARGYMSF